MKVHGKKLQIIFLTLKPQKGQNLKISKNKDIIFEISFQSNKYNYSSSVRFSVHFLIQSKLMKKQILIMD